MAGRPCTVCMHPRRAEIDGLLAGGLAFAKVGERFDLQASSLHRHREKHWPKSDPPKLTLVARAETQPETALSAVRALQRDTLDVLRSLRMRAKGEEVDHGALAVAKVELQALREMRENVALLARITGELSPTKVQLQGEGQRVEEMSDAQLRAELEREAG